MIHCASSLSFGDRIPFQIGYPSLSDFRLMALRLIRFPVLVWGQGQDRVRVQVASLGLAVGIRRYCKDMRWVCRVEGEIAAGSVLHTRVVGDRGGLRGS